MQVRAFLDITFLKMIVKANITANSELFDFFKNILSSLGDTCITSTTLCYNALLYITVLRSRSALSKEA